MFAKFEKKDKTTCIYVHSKKDKFLFLTKKGLNYTGKNRNFLFFETSF